MTTGRTTRQRKISGHRIGNLSEADKAQVAQSRLQALESDDPVGIYAEGPGSDDDNFSASSDDDDDDAMGGRKKPKRKAKSASKRKTRGQLADKRNLGNAKNFQTLLDEAELEDLPARIATYHTAAMGPSRIGAPRKWCSVCGCASTYTCVRCKSRFCSRKCYSIHVETRCLKFLA